MAWFWSSTESTLLRFGVLGGFSGMVRASQRPAPTDLEVGSIRVCLRSPIATDGTSASHVPFLGLVHPSVKADHQTKIVVLKLY